MSTVRETTYDLLRTRGQATIFGNPGSNELPFLDGFPDDFRYVLGLHEGAVLAMADGYAQATGGPALVNLHSAAGLGNAMGVLSNTRAVGTALVVTGGQQARAMVGLGSVLAEPAMTRIPEPQVKDTPGLDLPGLDAVRIAQGYGMPAERLATGEQLAERGERFRVLVRN